MRARFWEILKELGEAKGIDMPKLVFFRWLFHRGGIGGREDGKRG